MSKKIKVIISVIIMFSLPLSIYTIGFSSEGNTKIPILLYHHILSEAENENQKDNSCVVSLENFEQQMKYLYDNGFHTITSQELSDFLYKKIPVPPKSVMINFDDGYYSNIVRAYPVLKKYGFKATLFVIGDAVKEGKEENFNPKNFQFLKVESMEYTKDVFEYASHTNNLHSSIGDKTGLYLATKEQIIGDIRQSFKKTDSNKIFSYPLGQYNQVTLDAIKELKITMAVTTKEGYVTKDTNGLEIKRFIIFRSYSMKKFEKIVNGKA